MEHSQLLVIVLLSYSSFSSCFICKNKTRKTYINVGQSFTFQLIRKEKQRRRREGRTTTSACFRVCRAASACELIKPPNPGGRQSYLSCWPLRVKMRLRGSGSKAPNFPSDASVQWPATLPPEALGLLLNSKSPRISQADTAKSPQVNWVLLCPPVTGGRWWSKGVALSHFWDCYWKNSYVAKNYWHSLLWFRLDFLVRYLLNALLTATEDMRTPG